MRTISCIARRCLKVFVCFSFNVVQDIWLAPLEKIVLKVPYVCDAFLDFFEPVIMELAYERGKLDFTLVMFLETFRRKRLSVRNDKC